MSLRFRISRALLLCVIALSACVCLPGCSTRANGFYYYDHQSFRNFDVTSLWHEEEDVPPAPQTELSALRILPPVSSRPASSASADEEPYHTATVTARMMNVYASPTLGSRVVTNIPCGEPIELAYSGESFYRVQKNGVFLGYTPRDSVRAELWDNYYAYLPEETGMAPDANGNLVEAESHLVDVRLYTDKLTIKMKLATNGTTIGEPFYSRNLCMLQYDTLQKLMKAIDLFEADGYSIVIYDAYRPTSVQQRWFDVVRVHKWVADPSIGMGGIHDRGVAVDMTLMDANGVELDMPTAMHTFTEASARSSPLITAAQRQNMNYMTGIMTRCGFTYINSEWWHFQDSEIVHYLPTDHPIDSIPLIYAEAEQ